MKAYFATLVVLAVALRAMVCAGAEKGPNEASPAAKFFTQALAADAEGNPAQREKLLREALRVDPDFELAHWHLGQVYFQGVWRSVENVGQLVSADPRWQGYHDRLAALDNSPASHTELARWCREQRLENEAKWHWFQVLQADPENREALGNLNLKRYRGGYYTGEQLAELKERRAQAELDFKRFRREFKGLISSAEHAKGDERDKTVAKLAAVRDPAAISALMDTLVDASDDKRSDDFGKQVCQAIVAALSEMREHQATLKLVEIAIYAPHAAVRRSAAEGLRYREPTGYMPLLMTALQGPLEFSYSIAVLPSGHVTLVESVNEEGPESVRSRVLATKYLTRTTLTWTGNWQTDPNTGRRMPTAYGERAITQPARDRVRALGQATSSVQVVNQQNAARFDSNQRVRDVLEIVTSEELGEDPKSWWTAWKQYNELYTPDELPEEVYYDERNYTQERVVSYVERDPIQSMSCFIAGTPVWTQTGPKPIEQIAVGELVLSQDPVSGRLDYRPVVGTTVRPPTALVELAVDGEKIVTTRGHRFWVTGEGWRMAKFLNAGAALFGAGGSRTLSAAKGLEDETAYNLVVGEYHTYFVGESRLLVHDNNCPLPTTASVPGAVLESAR